MAALTAARDTTEISNGARHLILPVKGSTTIYQGALVALDASGYARPRLQGCHTHRGRPGRGNVANTGADGAATIRVSRGVFVFDNATDAGKLTTAHVLKPCYIADDQTVTATATGRQRGRTGDPGGRRGRRPVGDGRGIQAIAAEA